MIGGLLLDTAVLEAEEQHYYCNVQQYLLQTDCLYAPITGTRGLR